MKPLRLILLLLLVIIAACNDNSQPEPQAKEQDTEDSVYIETVDSVFTAETIDTFNTMGFSEYARSKEAPLNWGNFRLTSTWTEDSLIVNDFTPEKEYYRNYGRLLKYSPDSSQFIDLDSYNMHVRKNSRGQLVASPSGPDFEVSLIDTATGKKQRLLFLGPGSTVEDAVWLDNDNLALVGVMDFDDSTGKTATIWKYHIPTKTFFLYEWKDSSMIQQLSAWRKERLKGIIEE